MADERPFIRVHDGMPDHPKVDGLSDKAFRLVITSWCWCNRQRTDGRIPAARWKKQATPKARRELVAAGLAEELRGGDVQMHDYLDWQRSAAEIADMKAAKSQGGTWGNHKRWHLDEGIRKPGCPHCDALPIGEPIANESDSDRTTDRISDEGQRSRFGNNDSDKRSLTEKNSAEAPSSNSPVDNKEKAAQDAPPPIAPPIANGSESDRSPIASESESSSGRPTVSPDGSLGRHLPVVDARTSNDEDEEFDKITDRIIELLEETTSTRVDRAWAAKVRHQLLDDRQVKNPFAYVAAAIRGEPRRYLPASQPAEAGNAVIAQVATTDWDAAAETAGRGAERARALMAQRRKASPQ